MHPQHTVQWQSRVPFTAAGFCFVSCDVPQTVSDMLAVSFYHGLALFHDRAGRTDGVAKFVRLCALLRQLGLMRTAESAFSFVLFAAVRGVDVVVRAVCCGAWC